jgi:FkbM family methyltransferase
MRNNFNFDDAFSTIHEWSELHSSNTSLYKYFKAQFIDYFKNSAYRKGGNGEGSLGPIVDKLHFPYQKMGSIDSLDLFGLDELIIFAYYNMNKENYKKVADIGANLGLHSIIMSKNGWSVDAYEPDPSHISLFNKNATLNSCKKIRLNSCAVSNADGEMDFIRLLGNTTGSHIAGSKEKVYGKVEKFKVDVVDFKKIIRKYDLIKIDVEGQESNLLCSTNSSDWSTVDVIAEIGSDQNAKKIFQHLNKIKVNIFSQKKGWKIVSCVSDMPVSHKEGSVFISKDKAMHWE